MSALFISAPAFSRGKNVRANLGTRDQFPREDLHAMDSEVLRIKAGKQGRELHESFQLESAMKFVTFTTARGKKAFSLEGFCYREDERASDGRIFWRY